MNGLRTSRRLVLAAAAVTAGTALAGCGTVSRLLATIHPPTLTLPAPPLLDWSVAVLQAWQRVGLRFHLDFLPLADTTAPVDADWVSIATPGRNLRPQLAALNFTGDALTAQVRRAFTGPDGDLFALPAAIGEYQFYVDAARLKATFGVADHAQWTWDEMVHMLATTKAPQAAVAGWGWDEPRLWSAVATGLQGDLLLADGHLDWQRVNAATETLVSLLKQVGGWGAISPAGGINNPPTFVNFGFGPPPGQTQPNFISQPVFAFAPPWNMRLYPANPQFAPADCTTKGMCALVPRPFPTFPKGSPIPGLPWGLAPRDTPNLPLIGEFLGWLYRPSQQKVLMTLGFVPLIADAGVQQLWQRASAGASPTPRFDPQRYFDIASSLPIGFWSGAWLWTTLNLTTVGSTAQVATQMEYVRDNTEPGRPFPNHPSPPNRLTVS